MSIVERANAEADQAEAENPDAEPAEPIEGDDTPAEPEPEPEPEPSSLKVVEEQDKKLRSEATRHENALAKLHPEDWDQFAMCPLCIGDGFLTPIPPGDMPDMVWEAVTVLAGRFETGELADAPFAELCDVCKGRGVVKTSASATTMPTPTCRACAGYGWLDTDPPAAGFPPPPNAKKVAPAPPALVAVPAYGAQGSTPWPDYDVTFIPIPGAPADTWGRPAGHPRYNLPTTADGRTL